jgi:hypothetical protein
MSTGDEVSMRRVGAWLAGLGLTGALLVFIVADLLPLAVVPDYVQFWSAAQLLWARQDPYDPELQRQLQGPYLLGGYPVGYMYPPWLGLLWVPLVPLGFAASKAAWLVLNLDCLIGTAALLRPGRAELPRWIFYVMVLIFPFSVAALLIGQTSPLVLLLATLSWQLLERGHDRSAGAMLAWLSIKPQLTIVMLAAVLLWSARRRRWRVIAAFAVTLGLLCLISTLVLPSWPILMVHTMQRLIVDPLIGGSWLMVLQSLGVSGAWLPLLYLAGALPAAAFVLRAVWRDVAVSEIVGIGLLAAFVIAPYSQPYDYPVLLLPLFFLLRDRLQPRETLAVFLVFMVLPYIHLLYALPRGFQSKYTLFWVPAIMMIVWLASATRSSVPRGADQSTNTAPTVD